MYKNKLKCPMKQTFTRHCVDIPLSRINRFISCEGVHVMCGIVVGVCSVKSRTIQGLGCVILYACLFYPAWG